MTDFLVTLAVIYGIGVFVNFIGSIVVYMGPSREDKRDGAKLLRITPIWPLVLFSITLQMLREPFDD